MQMKRFRDPKWALIILFLGVLAVVPLAQIVIEAPQEQGVAAFDIFREWPTELSLRAYEKKLESANWAARFSRSCLQFLHFRFLKDGGEKVVVGTSGWYFYKPGLNYLLARPETGVSPNNTNDPVAAIVHFRDQLAAHGIHLLLVPVPNKESVYPDRVSARAEKLKGVLAPRTQLLFEKLRDAKVEVVDLFKEFRSAREQTGSRPEEPLYLAQDTHWSPSGVALAAKSVAHHLVKLGWIEPGNDEYVERNAPVQRRGDILHMMQTPSIESAVAPEKVAAVQVVRSQTTRLYNDEAKAEILVLGDSFMRIYQQDEPNAAGFIAHLAKELKRPMMSLVNDGGGATLVREELCARPLFLMNKKVVVWEFVERDIGLALKGWQRTSLPAELPKPPPDTNGAREQTSLGSGVLPARHI
jgi:hypothetical protein